MQRLAITLVLLPTLQACGGPPPSRQATPTPEAPTLPAESPYPTPSPALLGIRSPWSAQVGDTITLHADGRNGNGWFDGVQWSIDDSAVARFKGPAVGASVSVEVLAPGPIRIRAGRDGFLVKCLLGGIASPPPGRAIDLSAYGVDEYDHVSSGNLVPGGSRVVTSAAGWRTFTSDFPGVGRIPAPPKDLRLAPPPVDFAKSSLVILFEGLPNVTDPAPVLTRVDATTPGLVEVVRPRTNHLNYSAPAFAIYLKIFEVAKLPEGTRVRVIRE